MDTPPVWPLGTGTNITSADLPAIQEYEKQLADWNSRLPHKLPHRLMNRLRQNNKCQRVNSLIFQQTQVADGPDGLSGLGSPDVPAVNFSNPTHNYIDSVIDKSNSFSQ